MIPIFNFFLENRLYALFCNCFKYQIALKKNLQKCLKK